MIEESLPQFEGENEFTDFDNQGDVPDQMW